MNPLISVIVPCYNQAQYLEECLQSVLDQTYQNWECIIVNDGSPDHTEEVAKKWLEKDNRFRYVSKENGGLSSARNAGIREAKGEWIQFLDSDDMIHKSKFIDSKLYFENCDLTITDFQLFNSESILQNHCSFIDKHISYESMLFDWDIEYSIPIHCGIFRKSRIPFFDVDLKAKEDWFFWINLFQQNSLKYIIIKKKHALYRVHKNSMTKNYNIMIKNEIVVFTKIFKDIDEQLKMKFFLRLIEKKNNQISELKKINESLKFANNKLYNNFIFKFYFAIKRLIRN